MNLIGCDKIEINKPREGLKKIVEFSSKRGGRVIAWFSTKEKTNKKSMGLKYWILPSPIINLRQKFLFSIFGWGWPLSAWIIVWLGAQSYKISWETIWQKKFGSKNFWVQKILWHKNFWSKQFLVKKNFWSKNFLVKKIFGSKEFGSKNVWVEKIWTKKILGQKELSQK